MFDSLFLFSWLVGCLLWIYIYCGWVNELNSFFFKNTIFGVFFFFSCSFLCIHIYEYLFFLFFNVGLSSIYINLFFFNNMWVVNFVFACFFTCSVFFVLLSTRLNSVYHNIWLNLFILILCSISIIFSHSLVILFLSFECLLLLSINLLRLTSKSERIGEAISEMVMWTLFGSIFLLIGIFTISCEYGMTNLIDTLVIENSWVGLFIIIGFGVKIPIWPFFSWLLKAHVEASVEFSILLSGFIVKLGVICLWRILDVFYTPFILYFLVGISILAIADATLRLFMQNDLKKIVALTTILEMNWLNLCYICHDNALFFLANYLIVIHSITTAIEFLIVEFISKRYGTRDFWQITGLWFNYPILWYFSLLVVFITIGVPGTSIFMAKFLFLSAIASYSFGLFFYFLIIYLCIIPLFFIRLWVPIWFGLSVNLSSKGFDLSWREILLLTSGCLLSIIFGCFPTLIIF